MGSDVERTVEETLGQDPRYRPRSGSVLEHLGRDFARPGPARTENACSAHVLPKALQCKNGAHA
eukprot:1306685-Pyramimonas_sp.AAC.1